MKRIILLLSMMIGFSVIGIAGVKVVVTKSGGGFWGYSSITEYHNTTTNEHKLTCSGSGWSSCSWDSQPPKVSSYSLADDYVKSQIENGNLTGSAVISGAKVEWVGSDIYNYNLFIDAVTEE